LRHERLEKRHAHYLTPTVSGFRAATDLPTNVQAVSRAVGYVNTHRPRFQVRARPSYIRHLTRERVAPLYYEHASALVPSSGIKSKTAPYPSLASPAQVSENGYVCMCVCVCVCVCIHICVYMYVYVYIHMYVYIYIYTHTYIYIQHPSSPNYIYRESPPPCIGAGALFRYQKQDWARARRGKSIGVAPCGIDSGLLRNDSTHTKKPCPAVSEVKGNEWNLQWPPRCLPKPRQGFVQTRANCRSGSRYLLELLVARA